MPAFIAYFVAAAIAVGGGGQASGDAATIGDLAFGDRGPSVALLNRRLAEAGFNPDVGSTFGKKTRHAVYAFQKHYELATTGIFTPLMWDLLDEPITLPRRAQADRVEVDLAKQVLYLVEDQQVVLVIAISSGSGGRYTGSNGRKQTATTPEGVFQFERRVRGIRRARLGILYDPFYFKGGIAVHGSLSVPNYPASHGCIRVTMWDMELLKKRLAIGQAIYVYGDRTDPPPPAKLAIPRPGRVRT